MPCRCFSCDLSFDTVREFVEHKFTEHKLVHQEQPEKGMILGGGKSVSASSSKANYRDDIHCPNCGQPMKVVIQKEEAVLAASKVY
jgi:hypothetical protein